jgi:hypothetical protein
MGGIGEASVRNKWESNWKRGLKHEVDGQKKIGRPPKNLERGLKMKIDRWKKIGDLQKNLERGLKME